MGYADEMRGYWTKFAATGAPNGAGDSGAPTWPGYDATSDQYLELARSDADDDHEPPEGAVRLLGLVHALMRPRGARFSTGKPLTPIWSAACRATVRCMNAIDNFTWRRRINREDLRAARRRRL